MGDTETQKFFEVLSQWKDVRQKTALYIFLFTGFRRGEVCGLEWQDIDFENHTICVQRSVIFVKGYRKINPLGIYQKETLPQIRRQIMALKIITESYPNTKIKREYLLQILQSDTIKKYPIGGHWLINYDEFEQEFLQHFPDAKKID